jgi:hypothetical protein
MPDTPPPRLETEREVLEFVLGDLTRRLPPNWRLDATLEPLTGRNRPDAVVRVTSPDGSIGELIVEAKLNLEPRSVAYAFDQLSAASAGIGSSDTGAQTALVVARYLAPRTRQLIAESGASYADATGNIRITLDRPGVFLQASGAPADPWRTERQTRTLRGTPAARVVRALCDWRPPQAALEISERASASVGSVYRTLDLLDREALIRRGNKGPVLDVDVPGIIRRWSQDYDFFRRNKTLSFIEPRGQTKLLERLRNQAPLYYAVTGSLAAAAVSEYASPELITLYVDDIDEAASLLSLRPAEVGANVVLAEPFDPVVYARSTLWEGVKYCALSQVAADLLNGPGRNPSEAEELLRWMVTNERAWRL